MNPHWLFSEGEGANLFKKLQKGSLLEFSQSFKETLGQSDKRQSSVETFYECYSHFGGYLSNRDKENVLK